MHYAATVCPNEQERPGEIQSLAMSSLTLLVAGWPRVESVAEALANAKTLDADEIRRFLQ